MNANSTVNNTYYNISRQEGSEMAESPVIPPVLAQDYPRPRQSSQSVAGLGAPEPEKWRSRVPKTGGSPLVPTPLFSSEKCVVEIEPMAATSEIPASLCVGPKTTTSSPTSTVVPTTANPTPISPSPSLFPFPPSNEGIVASPVNIVSSGSLHASNSVLSRSSVYSQSTVGNTLAATRPRPVSSVYSQNTLTTMTVTAPSSPRTPTLTNWTSTLPGLPTSGIPPPEAQISANAYPQSRTPVPMEQVAEEQLADQFIQTHIQVPRLRSPSLPQDRGNRRRTTSYSGSADTHIRNTGSFGSRPLVQSPEPYSFPEMSTVVMDYEGNDWPLQKPSGVHNIPQKHYVSRSQGSNMSKAALHSYHVAHKESVSSSSGRVPGRPEHREPDVASPRASLADSHTPIFGPGEQRSGWWSDDDDAERGRGGNAGYAAIGMNEKSTPEDRRRRARKMKIIIGAVILAILIIVGVAVGVTFGVRR